jgi:hypothetical protein
MLTLIIYLTVSRFLHIAMFFDGVMSRIGTDFRAVLHILGELLRTKIKRIVCAEIRCKKKAGPCGPAFLTADITSG